MSDAKMIVGRLKDVFGDNPQFDEDMGKAMYATILQDLRTDRKEEYMSEVGKLISKTSFKYKPFQQLLCSHGYLL